jgi:triphosphoribosyl-dephospho-CoA synthase
MNFATFLTSARVLSQWFPRLVEIGYDNADVPASKFLSMLRPIGLLCENDMLAATGGINTHKGAIFSLGLICSAAGRLSANEVALTCQRICREVAGICDGLVQRELGDKKTSTAGERLFGMYGIAGARGEAASGYKTVRLAALPVYESLRADRVGADLTLLQVLLRLLSVNVDTNVVSRAGLDGLHFVQRYAQRLLSEGGVLASDGLAKLRAFDDELIVRNISPGGSADLLAVTACLVSLSARSAIVSSRGQISSALPMTSGQSSPSSML